LPPYLLSLDAAAIIAIFAIIYFTPLSFFTPLTPMPQASISVS
jgi:hypothetical protein